jgi:hypothetical protein
MVALADNETDDDHTTFSFDFKAFSREHASKFRLTCAISIIPRHHHPEKIEHGEACDAHDECKSGLCHYRHYFQLSDSDDPWEKVCLEEPTEFHACERDSDCEQLDNPFFEPYLRFLYDERLSEIYPQEKIQLLCGVTSMFSTDSNDIPNYHYDDDDRRELYDYYLQYKWEDLGYARVPEKICHLPLDFYTIKWPQEQLQFIGCVNDNQCMSGKCSAHLHLCLRRDGEECRDDDQCISGHCVSDYDDEFAQCLSS